MNELVCLTLKSRLILILHPNTERAEVVLNDRKFNEEQYHFTRKSEPVEEEALLLAELNSVIGVKKAEASKNSISLEISPCMYPEEWFPSVLRAVLKWGGKGYRPSVEVDDRRYKSGQEPEYDHDGWVTIEGVKQEKGAVNIGVEYSAFEGKA